MRFRIRSYHRHQKIDGDVGDQERGGDDQHRADDGVEILVQDDLDAVMREPGPAEHALDEEGIAQQRSDVQAEVGEDVDWPDGDERLHGRAAVRNYWSRRWARIHTQDKVAGITDLAPDRAAVRISQVIRDLDGVIVSTGEFEHAYQFKDGGVERMDLRKL